MPKTTNRTLERQNLRLVKQVYPGLTSANLTALRELTRNLHLSISTGEILYLGGKWYITHAGLLRIAARRRCLGIRTTLQERQCNPDASRWVFKATVYTSGDRRASSATAMPTHSTRPLWYAAPRCGLPKRGPSIALCARLMESGSARSRNWDHIHPPFRLRTKENQFTHRMATALPTASPDCGTSSAS